MPQNQQNHNMKHIGILSAFFAVVTVAVAQSGTNAPAGGAMSLKDCIQAALSHNFDVQVQRYNPQIALYNLDAAYSGYDPTFSASGQHSYNVSPGSYNSSIGLNTPSSVSDANSFSSGISGGLLPWGLTYGLSGNVSETYGSHPGGPFDSSGGNIGITLSQPLLKNFLIDSTRMNIRVNKNLLQQSEQGLRQQLITSVTAVANAYYDLIYAQQNVQVQTNALLLAQTQLDQDNQRVQIGTLAILSVQQDESQVAQSKANLIAAQSALDFDQNALKNLLTDNYSQWHDTDIQPAESLEATPQTFDLQDSWIKGMAKRPDLLQAKLNIERWGIQLKYDRNQLLPDLELTGSYGFTAASREFSGAFGELNEGDSPFYTYGAKLSVPLGNLGPRNQYKAAKATVQQIELQFKQLEQTIMVNIDNAVKTAQSDYQGVQARKEARIYAEAALDAEQKTYAVGKATTFEVLTYQNNLTAARLNEIQALDNYNKDLSNLALQEGSTLERYNINLEAK
jgi:outer membrane protein TolC